MTWNFGDALDAVATVARADDPALIHGDRIIPWAEFDRRTNRLARAMRALGAETGDKVGFYMRNQPEYMETLAACFKGRLTHVNVNYRYKDEELVYLFDNSDAKIIVYDAEFAPVLAAIRARLPRVAVFVEIDWEGAVSKGATPYEALASEGDAGPLGLERSGDDLLFLYTGGTTGHPKGVMWPHDTLRRASIDNARPLAPGPLPETLEEHLVAVTMTGRLSRQLPACPLMHGTGLFTAMGTLINGGAVVTLPTRTHFDPEELWREAARHKVTAMAIVGDAFARPMLTVLDGAPGKYDLSSLVSITSSGVMWSTEVKRGLLKHLPQAMFIDSFGASEAIGFGMSVMTAAGEVKTSQFKIGEFCKVFTEDGREVTPGSSEPGYIARGGNIPLGYYKDAEKTAKTFRTIDGKRYSVPGDWCTVGADGTLTLLGRGSLSINTGGEKVYPEEIEERLKMHPDVHDALVVGLPDPKWGQAITAVVAPVPGRSIDEAALKAFVREHLAGFKVPKHILAKADLGRAANGKADYAAIRAFALDALGKPN